VYSTYLGGSGNERGYGIVVDGSFNAYVTGHTSTSQGSVPGPNDFPTALPFQAQNASFGNFDAFVTKINAAGSGLVYSTFLGGGSSEFSLHGGAITVDGDGNAYVGGTTGSTNLPGASTSTIQATNGGGFNDAFVVKFNAAGSGLMYSTYLGGTAYDAVNGIAIDAARNAVVVGYTDSPNFPTASPLQGSRNGFANDAFVSKLNAEGSALAYSTYLGGSNGDIAYAVAMDSAGNAYISGVTASSNFPTVAPIQAVASGSGEAFISKLNPAGGALVYSTYLGGSTGSEHGYGIALDTLRNVYVTGLTGSSNFPTASPFQGAFGGGGTDAFVAKIVGAAEVPVNITATATTPTSVAISWTGSGGALSYQLLRSGGAGPVLLGSLNTVLVDTSALPNTAYLYKVRAIDRTTGIPTDYGTPDLATTVLFTNDPVIASSTLVKATHITELRTAVNAVRFLATELGATLPPFVFMDGSLASVAIKKTHIEELRTALGAARTALALPTVSYTDPVLTSGISTVKAAHIQELRAGVK
jgi:hypothetical protein